MSMRQVLDTVDGLLKDETLGLRVATESFAAAHPEILGQPGPYSADFNFLRGNLPGAPRTTTQPNVSLRPTKWLPFPQFATTIPVIRDANTQFEIGCEFFSASHEDNVNEATLVATALVRVLDQLRAYSELHNGTVIDILPPMDFSFGDFEGPASYGFLCRVTIQEQANE